MSINLDTLTAELLNTIDAPNVLIDVSASGDTTLINGLSNYEIQIVGGYLQAKGSVSVEFKGGSTQISPSTDLINGQILNLSNGLSPYITAPRGEDFKINLSAGVRIAGVLCYRLRDASTCPDVTNQPVDQTVTEGGTATFSVTASGSPLSYQWYRNGIVISGATSSSYTTPTLSLSDNRSFFQVVVSNDKGTVKSQRVMLAVVPATTPLTAPIFLASATNSKPAVRFTNDKFMKIADPSGALFSPKVSVFAAVRYSDPSSGANWPLGKRTDANSGYVWMAGCTGALSAYVATSGGGAHLTSDVTPSADTFIIQTFIDNDAVSIRQNGVDANPNAAGDSDPAADLVDTPASPIWLGDLVNFGDGSLRADFAEIIIISGAVSNSDRNSLEAYLEGKYAVGGASPAPFDPTTVSGLKSWLKADDLSLNDGDLVGTWPDASGNGNNANA